MSESETKAPHPVASDPELHGSVTPAIPGGDEAVLQYAQASTRTTRRRRLRTFFTFYSILLVVLPIIFLIALAYLLRQPLPIFVIGCFVYIPASIFFFLIKYFIRNEMVPTSFLMDQIFIGAIPGVVISTIAKIVVLAIICHLVFSTSILFQFVLLFRQIGSLASANARDKLLFIDRYRNTSIYGIVLYGPLVIGAVSAFLQEFAKMSVAFRCEQLLHYGPALGPRGAVATAAAAGLGFATTQILGYSLLLLMQGISFNRVGLVLGFSLLLLPLHVGTAFFMGVAIAKKKILHVKASVFGAYLTAVLFSFVVITGNLYLAGILFYRRFFFSEGFSAWIYVGVIFGKILLIALLMFLCKRALKTMDLERYELPGFEIEDEGEEV